MGIPGVNHCAERVARKFCSNLRVLFNQIIEESRQYETLHSVTAQIEQNYHGRFAVELIQNANDAIQSRGRVRFVRRREAEAEYLYAANDGTSFEDKDFENICDLGLSDKDPSRDIGNKGFGFRSVLEVTTNPRIYSKARDGDTTAGYCFDFGTSTRDLIHRMLALYAGNDSDVDGVLSEFLSLPVRLYPAGSAVPQELSRSLKERPQLIKRVPEKVQVYTYPRPRRPDVDATVLALWEEGFASVIVLPLDRKSAPVTADQALADLEPEALLFLTRADSIELSLPGDARPSVVFEKHVTSASPRLSKVELKGRAHPEATSKSYLLSSTDVEGAELLAAQADLPASWKPLKKARVSVAVAAETVETTEGYFAIGLPTELKTGSGAWIDAPFYGDISRKHIDFSLPLNGLLLTKAASFLPSFLSRLCVDGSMSRSIAALQSIHFTDSDTPLAQVMLSADNAVHKEIAASAVVRPFGATARTSSKSLLALQTLRLPPHAGREPLEILTPKALSRYASLPSEEYQTAGMDELLEGAANAFGGGSVLTWDELCKLLDDIAGRLRDDVKSKRASAATFRSLYNDLKQLLPGGSEKAKLLDKAILLDTSLELHRQADARPVVFDQPQRSGEGEDISALIDAMPDVLGAHIRFLHDETIERTLPGKPRSASMDLLRGSPPPLVREFEVRDLVNDGVLRCYAGRTIDDEVGQSLLRWTYHLWYVVARGTPSTGANWSFVRVPTRNGWQQARFAYLSAGWEGEVGELLEQALLKEDSSGSIRPFLPPPEQFLRMMGPPPVMPEGGDPTSNWLSFLTDVLRVNQTPRVVVRTQDNAKVAEDFVCWGHNYRLRRSALKHDLRIPPVAWERFQDYLEACSYTQVSSLIKDWRAFVIDRFVSIDGIEQVTSENAPAFFRLVTGSFESYRPYLTFTLRRKDSGATTTLRSTLSFIFRHIPWIPATAEGKYECRDADGVLWIDPSDLSRNPGSPTVHDLLPHVPREFASQAAGIAAKELGIKSPDDFNREDGIRWLAWYHAHWPLGGSSVWRSLAYDLIERTAKAHAAMAGTVGVVPPGCPWEQVLVDGVASDEASAERLWKPSPNADAGDGPVFVPDQPVLANQLRGKLPLVAASARHAEILRLLTWRFGNGSAQLVSALETMPTTGGSEITESGIGASKTLQDTAPWLIRAVLSVLALGRPHQRMTTRNLKETARRLSGMRVLVVDNLDVRVLLPGGSVVPLARKAFAWPEENALVVDSSATDDLRLLLEGIGQYLDDQDLAQSTLYRIHSLAPTGLTTVPTDAALTAALVESGFDLTRLEEVRRLISADTEWVMQRLLPALLSVAPRGGTDLATLVDPLERGFDPDQPKDSLVTIWNRLFSTPLPAGFDDVLAVVLSDKPVVQVARLAHSLWGVSLASWNEMAAKVAPSSANIQNTDATSSMLLVHEQLLPAARALLREELTRTKDQTSYRVRCQLLEALPAAPEECFLTWTPPLTLFVTPIAAALAMSEAGESLPAWAAELIPQPGEAVADVITRLTRRGLAIRDDEDAVLRANTATAAPLLDQLQICGLARWAKLDTPETLPPTALILQDPHGNEDETVRDQLESLLSFNSLRPDQLQAWLRLWWIANDLDEPVAELPTGLNLADLPAAWEIDASQLDRAKKLREELRQGIRRIQNTRQVLGKKYVVPDGDVYTGLRQLIDDNLNPEVATDVNPASPSPLGRPPAISTTSGPRGAGGDGGVARTADEFAGAIGEYVAFTVLRKISGGRIRESAWKGANRRHFCDDGGEGNDDLGYDFEFTLAGRQYQVEVKATKSKRPSQVQLGPSEVRAASEAALTARVTWQIWLVSDVLSNPELTVLVNPYDAVSRDRYRIDGVGARVHFQLPRST